MTVTDQTLVKASYYRSQLYTAYLGINPLVAAAHPIFSLVERINLSRQLVFNDNLSNIVEHELKAFETRAGDADYDGETIIICRYMLSSIIQASVKQHNLSLPLLSYSKEKDDKDDRFFDIIERLISKPDLYLDVLELSYLCLSTGLKDEAIKVDEQKRSIKERLFQLITTHRVFDKKPQPAKAQEPLPITTSSKPILALKAGSFSLLIAATVFISGNLFINHSAKHYQNLNFKGSTKSSWTK